MTKVVITGSTGMVGSATLRALLTDDRVTQITSITRRSTGIEDAKLTEVLDADFSDADTLAPHFHDATAVFHCIATYAHTVDRDTYDFTTVTCLKNVIKAASRTCPTASFALFSASGASPDERSYYRALNTKGRAEKQLLYSGFPRKLIFRPGYIGPSREEHVKGFSDRIVRALFRLIPVIGILDDDLGRAIVSSVFDHDDTEATYSNPAIRKLAGY